MEDGDGPEGGGAGEQEAHAGSEAPQDAEVETGSTNSKQERKADDDQDHPREEASQTSKQSGAAEGLEEAESEEQVKAAAEQNAASLEPQASALQGNTNKKHNQDEARTYRKQIDLRAQTEKNCEVRAHIFSENLHDITLQLKDSKITPADGDQIVGIY